jgi:hypothetical protein
MVKYRADGTPGVAKVYTAFGHTRGIEGNLPDRFIASEIVDDRFFTLKATGGGFIQFVEDVPVDVNLLQGIIMDNEITLALVQGQFAGQTTILVSAFLDYLRSEKRDTVLIFNFILIHVFINFISAIHSNRKELYYYL